MLRIENLSVGFDIGAPTQKIVLRDFNLDVEDGEFVVLLGSNGAGKSTLFNAILGTVPYKGNIKLNEVVTYIKAGASAVGVGRNFYQGFSSKEIALRTKDILKELKDFSAWNNKK